ncbi:hypothetical protein AMAG_08582 [Allomyces macrogynus ATCC 38327]|uniref:GAF domain-containing protein n=1 Tax=Allomyces macrogynus (strain ATCC 38327) TaxID=578462 RepID=A0A0L0SLT3_ALLM3|nr:hypothetical protein AMAG_08582 [Allomyces macrogynus ATCC 38327]|eukprot:KNE63457.1 hypothetical protein AMAG_08582 [Allomyces macrogynus ATCC 38327]
MRTLPTNAAAPTAPKSEFYADLAQQAAALIEGERNWVTNTANVSALVYHALRDRDLAVRGQETVAKTGTINWVGFYVKDKAAPPAKKGVAGVPLTLGPFQGKIACTKIPPGKGVCGAAAARAESVVVEDVHMFPGHIACDALTNSEVVVPLVLPQSGQVIGVFDLDCEASHGFDHDDARGLEKIARLVLDACDWTPVLA